MTYETFVKEMLDWFPSLRSECSAYMDDDDPLPYVAIGCVLNPWLETCLEARDVASLAKAGEFVEAAAAASRSDARLADLIGIEIGEWLPGVRERKLLLSYLGPETHKLCGYHISRLPD
ncbi:MAG: hypothetical protein WA869_29505 [Alloacidobacterium sp.]